jgi:hypothetical protein
MDFFLAYVHPFSCTEEYSLLGYTILISAELQAILTVVFAVFLRVPRPILR